MKCNVSRLTITVSFTVAAGACSGDEPPSVGIPEPAAAERERWTPAPRFTSREGVLDGEPIVFHMVFAGAFDSADGVVVAGLDAGRLIFLDSAGNITETFGRRGNGPGEFELVERLVGTPDGIIVMDLRNRRVSMVHGRAIVWQRSLQLPASHRFVGMLPDSTVVTTLDTFVSGLGGPRVPQGTVRSYYLWDASGGPPTAIPGGIEPAPAIIRYEDVRSDRAITVTDSLGESCLAAWRYGIAGDRIFLADAENGVLAALGRSGEMEVLYDHPPDTVTTATLEKLRDWLEERRTYAPVPPQGERAYFERIGDIGDPLPSVWSAMLIDSWGTQRIWLRRASCFEPYPSEVWEVFHTDGRLEATVELPPKTRLLAAKGRRMLAVVTDALGVESISVLEAR